MAKDFSELIRQVRLGNPEAAAGLPPILAPEMRGDFSAALPAADVFALGHVFKFLRTGGFPFKSMKISDVPPQRHQVKPSAVPSFEASEVISSKLARVRKPRSSPRWDKALDSLTDEMTQIRVELRIGSMEEVLQRLHCILNDQTCLSEMNAPSLANASSARSSESATDADPPAAPPVSGIGLLGGRIRQYFKRV
jgi:hypothetical protein